MSRLTLRALRPEDLDRVSEIERLLAGQPRRGFLEKRFAAAAADPDRFITSAALCDDVLTGYGFVRLQEGEFGVRGAVAVLDVIGVDPGAQGRGAGRAVLAHVEERMKEKGIGTLRTQVVWTNTGLVGFFSSAGFTLAPCRIVERAAAPLSEVAGEESLTRERFPVRSLKEEDLASVVRIDRKLTGRDRSAYYGAKFREMLVESGIRVSLAAEDAGIVAGFVMARVDFGEFGRLETAAVIDTIGVHPAYGRSGVGRALLSQLLLNLSSLQVESVLVQVSPENFSLQRFLHAHGFVPSQRLALARIVQ